MVLRSLHRLSPQALRFLSVAFQQKDCCWLIQGMDCPLPYPLFPVYRFFCAVASFAIFGVRLYVSIVAGGSVTIYNSNLKSP